jgi:membrane fusion protein (multidrug efflux system)
MDGRMEIIAGLLPGDKVVTEGVVKVADGMEVRLAGTANAKPQPSAKGGA